MGVLVSFLFSPTIKIIEGNLQKYQIGSINNQSKLLTRRIFFHKVNFYWNSFLFEQNIVHTF